MKTVLHNATVVLFLAVATASPAQAFELFPTTSSGSAVIPSFIDPTSGSVGTATVTGHVVYSSGTSITVRDSAGRVASIWFPRNGDYRTHPDLETGAHDAMRKLLKLAYQNQRAFRVSITGIYIYRYYFGPTYYIADADTILTLNRTVWPSSREGELAKAIIGGTHSRSYGWLTLFRRKDSMNRPEYQTFSLLRADTSSQLVTICEGEDFAGGVYQSYSQVQVTRLEWYEVNEIIDIIVSPTWGVLFDHALRPVSCANNQPRSSNRLVHGGGPTEFQTTWSNI